MRNYTFFDGVKVPAGEVLAVPSGAIHMDPTIYENPDVFDGFRFSKLREQEGHSAKHHSVNTSCEFLSFGHGRHAWYITVYFKKLIYSPGRFFGISEQKLMLAFVLLKYDLKTKTGKRPENHLFQGEPIPDTTAEILFRKRRV